MGFELVGGDVEAGLTADAAEDDDGGSTFRSACRSGRRGSPSPLNQAWIQRLRNWNRKRVTTRKMMPATTPMTIQA